MTLGDVIFRCLLNNNDFTELWKGNWGGRYKSHSEADLALIRKIQQAGGSRTDADQIFRRSGLFRAKWTEMRGTKTYGEITLDKVFNQ